MAGGGTGGHIMPLVAVARELRQRGHRVVFIGTRRGLESRLAPAEGFPIEWIEIGGLNRVGLRRALRSILQVIPAVLRARRVLLKEQPGAVFSLGGYVAGPVVLAAWLERIPVALMEPNAVAGLTNRWMGRLARRALVNFPETVTQFPAGKTEVTGVPVRPEFFAMEYKAPAGELTLLVTGGSQGSRRLNDAVRQSWPLFRESNLRVRFIHQTGRWNYEELAREFASSGLPGEVVSFIDDMPGAFRQADLVICRSGAGAVAELAAAGRPSILVPFPFAAGQHQLRNAELMARAGAARLIPESELSGRRLFEEVAALAASPETLARMSEAARKLARPNAAARAADVLEELASERKEH